MSPAVGGPEGSGGHSPTVPTVSAADPASPSSGPRPQVCVPGCAGETPPRPGQTRSLPRGPPRPDPHLGRGPGVGGLRLPRGRAGPGPVSLSPCSSLSPWGRDLGPRTEKPRAAPAPVRPRPRPCRGLTCTFLTCASRAGRGACGARGEGCAGPPGWDAGPGFGPTTSAPRPGAGTEARGDNEEPGGERAAAASNQQTARYLLRGLSKSRLSCPRRFRIGSPVGRSGRRENSLGRSAVFREVQAWEEPQRTRGGGLHRGSGLPIGRSWRGRGLGRNEGRGRGGESGARESDVSPVPPARGTPQAPESISSFAELLLWHACGALPLALFAYCSLACEHGE